MSSMKLQSKMKKNNNNVRWRRRRQRRRQKEMLQNVCVCTQHTYSAMNRENHTKNLYSLITLLQFIFIYVKLSLVAWMLLLHASIFCVVVAVVAEFIVVSYTTCSLNNIYTYIVHTHTHIRPHTNKHNILYYSSYIMCFLFHLTCLFTLASSCQDTAQKVRKASAICFRVQPRSELLFLFS